MRAGWTEAIGADRSDPRVRRRVRDAERLRAAGRVMSVRVLPGVIEGRVQGSHARPHVAELRTSVWDADRWDAVGELLGRQARHYAGLLVGRLPDRFDETLAALGLSLVPAPDEWDTTCTCGEPAPCVHRLAVWSEVAERVRDEPYLLTRLRGRGREQLLGQVRDRWSDDVADAVPLDALRSDSWARAATAPDDVPLPPVRPAATTAGPLRMLGDPPGWPGPTSAADLFAPAVVGAARRAARLRADRPGTAPRTW